MIAYVHEVTIHRRVWAWSNSRGMVGGLTSVLWHNMKQLAKHECALRTQPLKMGHSYRATLYVQSVIQTKMFLTEPFR